MRKKGIAILILSLLLLALSAVLFACQPSDTFSVTYTHSAGGTVSGNCNQTIEKGGNAETVTAIPDTGYNFLKWSDNDSTEYIRTDTNISKNISATAIFEKQEYTATYIAGSNGTITGTLSQIVKYGENGTAVTAVPDTGYRFVKWSDNDSTEPIRTDTNISGNIEATAVFEKIVNTYTYVYNNSTDFFAEQNNTAANVTIRYENLSQASFAVAIREYFTFDGWYLDADFETQVSDGQGRLVIDHTLFDSESRNLYAKWTVNEVITYKILMVFVTEVKATLQSNAHARFDYDNTIDVEVDYKMTEAERQACKLLVTKFSQHLNDIFDGLVIFEIDYYFTTVPLGKANISQGIASGWFDYGVFADDIPEVSHLLDDYRTIMTTFGMNDFDGLLHMGGGSAGAKYASMHFEVIADTLFSSYEVINAWGSLMDHYTHEFIHTVETAFNTYEFHDAAGYYLNNHIITDNPTINTLYLLNQMTIDGKRVGIPYSAWQGYIPIRFYTDRYDAEPYVAYIEYGGTIGQLLDEIDYTPEREGYTFTGWFYGYTLTSPVRPDETLTFYRYFYAGWQEN